MLKMIGTALFCLTFVISTYGSSPCDDLSGTWRNQLGSNMTIERMGGSQQKITGQYNTSVESSRGASAISSMICGLVQPVEGGSLVTFNVLWNKGASITSWVGQCMVCGGQAKIHTTWVLRSLQTPHKRWMSTRINQDTFWRVGDVELSSQQASHEENAGHSELLGKWTSVTGDSFEINRATESGCFEGTHCSGSENGGAVFGKTDGNETYSAFGFAAAHPTQIKGWTGHIYHPQEPNQVMETSWLSQAFSDNCNDPRKFVQYGMDYYRKDAAQGA